MSDTNTVIEALDIDEDDVKPEELSGSVQSPIFADATPENEAGAFDELFE